MKVEVAKSSDFNSLINLAKEVEDLFGPMADEVSFHDTLKDAILQKTVFCIRTKDYKEIGSLQGGIIISKESNEIMWFVVSDKHRKRGIGTQLLKFALRKLDPKRDIVVQTFDESVLSGKAARKIYFNSGFEDFGNGGLNPAGVPTVIMHLPKLKI